MRVPLGLLVLMLAPPRPPRPRFVMFDQPRHGTECSRCEKTYHTGGERRSEYPASTRCQWCLAFVCSNHAEAVFDDDNSVRACTTCAPKIKASEAPGGTLRGPGMAELAGWQLAFGSKTFRGYAR